MASYATASMPNFRRFGGVVVEILKVSVIWRGAGGGVDAKKWWGRVKSVTNTSYEKDCINNLL